MEMIEKCFRLDPTCLNEDEMPPLFRLPFIRFGYRRINQPWTYYLRSLFTVHNETVNVWTHLIGAACMTVGVLRFCAEFAVAAPYDSAIVALFGVSSALPQLVSAVAHLTHSRSERVHILAYCFDYVGVGGVAFTYNLLTYCFFSHPDFYDLFRSLAVPVMAFVSFMVPVMMTYHLVVNHRLASAAHRFLTLLPHTVYICITAGPLLHKLLRLAQGLEVHIQPLHILHLLINGLSFPLYVFHVPEKWWPGRFDIVGCGHQWFHVGTSVGNFLVFDAVRNDLRQSQYLVCSQRSQLLSLPILCVTEALIYVGAIGMVFYLSRNYQSKIK